MNKLSRILFLTVILSLFFLESKTLSLKKENFNQEEVVEKIQKSQEDKNKIKSTKTKISEFIKKHKIKLTVFAAATIYSGLSYCHLINKKSLLGHEKKLKQVSFLNKFLAAQLIPIKETLSLFLNKKNSFRLSLKYFINQILLNGCEKN